MPSRPKLLALDMDGTLLNSQKRISPRTIAALYGLAHSGVVITLSTGRGLAEIADYRDELSWLRYASLDGGALVYDLEAKRPIDALPIPDTLVLSCIGIGRREGVMVHMSTTTGSVVEHGYVERSDEFGVGIYQPMFDRRCERVDDIARYVQDHPCTVVKIDLFHLDSASRERTFGRLSAGSSLSLKRAEATSVECTPVGVNKATGLQKICELLDIGMGEVVAIGDADNDMDVLKAAGTAVAMGNANERIRMACDVVVADCDHDGIVEAIEWLF